MELTQQGNINMPKNIPIGIDNFAKLVDKDNSYLFADKTLFVKAIIDDKSEVTLITRPRRWGKTLNMSVLHHFFASEVHGRPTQGLFDGLKIEAENEGAYMRHQGQYPVIFISFKDVKENSYDEAINNIKKLIQELYREHEALLDSDKLREHDKELIKKYLNGSIDTQDLERAIRILSELLYKHHKKPVYILIDEYDTPLNAAYTTHLDDMTRFMKNLFSAALKGNPYLKKGVMTGILRISKDSMLSGLNNVKTHTLLDDTTYHRYFGFTEEEVNQLFSDSEIALDTEIQQQIKTWYNGYLINDLVLYNPLSIIQCIDHRGELRSYWINTADDSLLKNALLNASESAKEQFAALIEGQSTQASVGDTIHFHELSTNDTALWSLLLAAGYLTYDRKVLNRTDYTCSLRIANQEVTGLYLDVFANWLKQALGVNKYQSFMQDLVTGNIASFSEKLGNYLTRHTSGHDFTRESNYHTFVLGLLCSITDTHYLHSNLESGVGRPDVLLIPKDKDKDLAIILEFKYTKENQDQEKRAEQALEQIDVKHYQSFIEQYDYIKRILKMGVAFQGKSVFTFHRIDDLENSPLSEITCNLSHIEFDEESDEEESIPQRGRKRSHANFFEEDSPTETPKKKKPRVMSTSSPRFFSGSELQSSPEEEAYQSSPSSDAGSPSNT